MILVLVLIWGTNFSVVKAALEEFSPLAFNALRFVLASSILFLLLRTNRETFQLESGDLKKFIALGRLGNVVYQMLFISGVYWTLAGNAALLLATVPIFVSLFSTLLGHEKIDITGWLGVALSVAVAWSAYTVGAAPLVKHYGPLRATAGTMWIGTLVLVLISTPALIAQNWSGISAGAWGGLLFSGGLSIAFACIIWYYGVRHLGSSRTAVYSNTVPLVALAVAWVSLGETPTWTQLAGAAAIVGGVLLSKLGPSSKPARPGVRAE